MLCCVGLIGGLAVGQSLGGYWTITAPAIGFGLGLYGDMKFMHGMHGRHVSRVPSADMAAKQVKEENLALQESGISIKGVQRDSS